MLFLLDLRLNYQSLQYPGIWFTKRAEEDDNPVSGTTLKIPLIKTDWVYKAPETEVSLYVYVVIFNEHKIKLKLAFSV